MGESHSPEFSPQLAVSSSKQGAIDGIIHLKICPSSLGGASLEPGLLLFESGRHWLPRLAVQADRRRQQRICATVKNHEFQMRSIGFFLSLLALLTACTSRPAAQGLTLAVAANMQFAMDELTAQFTAQTGIPCQVVISSSGKLTAQIREGAPFDVFVSADMKYPQTLHAEGLTAAPPRVYARGRLVLWSLYDDIPPYFEQLSRPAVSHVALANPQTAPYGVAARSVLQHHQLWDSLAKKFVFGESISQTNQFILSRSAEIGFTALSVVLSPRMKGQGQWREIPPDLYAPIEQGVVQLRREGVDPAAARRFYDFLFSSEAQQVLEEFGYFVDESTEHNRDDR